MLRAWDAWRAIGLQGKPSVGQTMFTPLETGTHDALNTLLSLSGARQLDTHRRTPHTGMQVSDVAPGPGVPRVATSLVTTAPAA